MTSQLRGDKAAVAVPEREHPLDDYIAQMLEGYQGNWEVIGLKRRDENGNETPP